MSDFIDDLGKSLKIFDDGMKRFGTTRAINQAQDELNTVNTMETDEAAKRQKQMMIAQNLAMHMTKTGADPSQIQMSAGVITPKPLTQTDDWAKMSRQDDLAERASGRKFTHDENVLNRSAQLEIAGIKSGKNGGRLKPLTDKHVDELASWDDDKTLGTSLLGELKQKPWLVGPAAGRVPGRGVVDPNFASFNQAVQTWFDGYRQKVTGAGASDQELQRLEGNRPTVKDSPSQFEAKVSRIIQVGQNARKRKLKTLEMSGRDVRRFMENDATATEQAADTAPAPDEKYNKYMI